MRATRCCLPRLRQWQKREAAIFSSTETGDPRARLHSSAHDRALLLRLSPEGAVGAGMPHIPSCISTPIAGDTVMFAATRWAKPAN